MWANKWIDTAPGKALEDQLLETFSDPERRKAGRGKFPTRFSIEYSKSPNFFYPTIGDSQVGIVLAWYLFSTFENLHKINIPIIGGVKTGVHHDLAPVPILSRKFPYSQSQWAKFYGKDLSWLITTCLPEFL
jgi:hypothetical protein